MVWGGYVWYGIWYYDGWVGWYCCGVGYFYLGCFCVCDVLWIWICGELVISYIGFKIIKCIEVI